MNIGGSLIGLLTWYFRPSCWQWSGGTEVSIIPALFPKVWCETDLCFWLALKLNFTVTQIGKQAQYMQPVTTQLQMKFGM
jgi:hypothetical protein